MQNDSFLFRSSGGATLPLPAKAPVVSQPVNAWYPGKAKQSSLPKLLPICVKLMKRRRFFVPVRNTIVAGISKHLPSLLALNAGLGCLHILLFVCCVCLRHATTELLFSEESLGVQ